MRARVQYAQQFSEVHRHFLLRQREGATPKADIILHVVDLLEEARANRVVRRIRAQDELVGIIRRIVQRRVDESSTQGIEVPLLFITKLPLDAVLQQVRQRV